MRYRICRTQFPRASTELGDIRPHSGDRPRHIVGRARLDVFRTRWHKVRSTKQRRDKSWPLLGRGNVSRPRRSRKCRRIPGKLERTRLSPSRQQMRSRPPRRPWRTTDKGRCIFRNGCPTWMSPKLEVSRDWIHPLQLISIQSNHTSSMLYLRTGPMPHTARIAIESDSEHAMIRSCIDERTGYSTGLDETIQVRCARGRLSRSWT